MSIAFLSVGSIVSYSVYAEDEDDYNSSTSLDQEMDQNQNAKLAFLVILKLPYLRPYRDSAISRDKIM